MTSHVMAGDYTAAIANFMSPGEPTYFLMTNFTAASFMSKVSGNIVDPDVVAALKIAFAETDQAKS